MPNMVRMAYATGASLNAILTNQLNFRAAGNAPISSVYTLYANGQGQTYWSNSVSPADLSTLSTTIGTVYTQVEHDLQSSVISTYNAASTLIYQTVGSYTGLSSQFSTFEYYTISSFSSAFRQINTNSTNIGTLSLSTNNAFLSTANSFQIQLNSFYLSTLNVMYSTVNAISSISTFLVQINAVQNSVNIGLSTVSTSAALQTALTSNAITSTFNYELYSTTVWTSTQLASVLSSQVSITNLNTFSTQINSSLISTSIYLSQGISTNTAVISSLNRRVSTLELEYFTISTNTINVITSTFFSTNISPIIVSSYAQSTLLGRTISSLSAFSTVYFRDISSLVASTNSNVAQISSLSYQFSIITTSSILAGIYETFMQLEAYTVALINSTNAAYIQYLSSGFSTFYTSSLYASTATVGAIYTSTITVSSINGLLLGSGGVFNVSPIRATSANGALQYNPVTYEITYNSGKTFVIEHPKDESKYLVHACLEGPEVGVYYRGIGTIADLESSATITLPDYVDALATDFTVHVSPIYNGTMRLLNVSCVSNSQFTVYGDSGKFHWHVYGRRGNLDVDPDKVAVDVCGEGPYRWIKS